MSELSSTRRERILLWLQDQTTMTIEALAERLDVSVMTVHRDLNDLVRIGAVEKVHGGARLAGRPLAGMPVTSCVVCGGNASERSAFIISQTDAAPQTACCPHCGMLMHGIDSSTSILARDFLYGRMVNARQARYVFASSVTLCCHPSVLCFASQDDAERFQQGFGGTVMRFEQARDQIAHEHGTCSGSHN